jgi:hypothetical protein
MGKKLKRHSAIYELVGTGGFEGMIFAQCTSEEACEKAIQIMDSKGWNVGLLEIRKSNMRLNQLRLSHWDTSDL